VNIESLSKMTLKHLTITRISPTHILAHITAARRRHLLEYLLRWGGEHFAARAVCLDGAENQPPLAATMRAARATRAES